MSASNHTEDLETVREFLRLTVALRGSRTQRARDAAKDALARVELCFERSPPGQG